MQTNSNTSENNDKRNSFQKLKDKFKLTIIEIVSLGIYLALIILFTQVPFLGIWKFGPIEITIVPLIIGIATVHLGFIGGVYTGSFIGLFIYIAAITRGTLFVPATHFEVAFLPRMATGFAVVGIYYLLGCNKNLKIWKVFIVIFSSAFFNTVFFTIYIFIFGTYNSTFSMTLKAWVVAIWVNAIVEWIIAGALGTGLYELAKSLNTNLKNRKGNSW